MNLIDHPSPNHSPRKPGVRVDTIVIHHTGSSDAHSALSWMKNPESKVSAHYLIGAYGHVYRLVPENRTAWHVGVSCFPWDDPMEKRSLNLNSIGIELVNPGDGTTPFTESQYLALGELLPPVCARLGVNVLVRPTERLHERALPVYIFGHRDVAPGRKTDPADNFDWGRVRAALSGRVA